MFTDASSIGVGGYFQGKWFSKPIEFSGNIAFDELFAIYVAICAWGVNLQNTQILVFCDNEAVGEIWKSGSCKNQSIMALVRKLFFVLVKFNINLIVRHIPGKKNIFADLLSSFR